MGLMGNWNEYLKNALMANTPVDTSQGYFPYQQPGNVTRKAAQDYITQAALNKGLNSTVKEMQDAGIKVNLLDRSSFEKGGENYNYIKAMTGRPIPAGIYNPNSESPESLYTKYGHAEYNPEDDSYNWIAQPEPSAGEKGMHFGDFFSNLGGSLLSAGGSALTGGFSDLYSGFNKVADGEGLWAGIDRAVDPGGVVDTGLRGVGELLPGIQSWAPAAGTMIGGVVGTAVPVLGTTIGATIGNAVGNKIRGTSYGESFKNAAMTYATGKAGELLKAPPTAYEAAMTAADPELAYILSDMGEALKPGYAGTLGDTAAGAAAGKPLVYGSPEFYKAAGEVGMSPAEAAQLPISGEVITKDILKALAKKAPGLLAPTAAAMPTLNKMNPVQLPNYQTTGNQWNMPGEMTEEQKQQLLMEEEKKKIMAMREEDDLRQAYLKQYLANIPPKPDVVGMYLS